MKNINLFLLFLAVCLLSGCGLAQAGALSAFESNYHFPDDASREKVLSIAEKYPLEALVSSKFYEVATPNDVEKIINIYGASLKNKNKRSFSVGSKSEWGGSALVGILLPIYQLESDAQDPLTIALKHSPHVEVIKKLVQAGCNPIGRSKDYAERGHNRGYNPEILSYLLSYSPNIPEIGKVLQQRARGYSYDEPDDLEFMRVLLTQTKNLGTKELNYQEEYDSKTPLMNVCGRGNNHGNSNEQLVFLLLQLGADSEITLKNGERAIGFALERGNYNIAKEMIKYGVNTTYLTNKNETLLNKAVPKYQQEPDHELFLMLASKVEATGEAGQNALKAAIYVGSVEATKILIKRGAKLNSTTTYDIGEWTPKQKEVIALKTPKQKEMIALQKLKQKEMIAFLKKNGMKFNTIS
ncbi:ankyrin repeat domain-containing protein [Desulfovibrio litoralis]|uniref:Uncharacterized protein n=1 Tax=Desulfovibrio litoralis DSM 11393 TaxID=1121455 RepID=A0A1M7SX30_9BACT|nr:ankyrin repeat domain-containing protein [Desulfovibrio litoralis]SHN63000.1 hypothetical protein SAMN02745728_01325 [Desulfovibrio litoralis DSM 11393]